MATRRIKKTKKSKAVKKVEKKLKEVAGNVPVPEPEVFTPPPIPRYMIYKPVRKMFKIVDFELIDKGYVIPGNTIEEGKGNILVTINTPVNVFCSEPATHARFMELMTHELHGKL